MTTAPVSLLSVAHLSAAYGATNVLDDVSFTAETGELIGLCGPNGSGKSTLLRALVGLQPTSAGSVRVAGRTAGEAAADLSYVPQHAAVDHDFPITVREVVSTGRLPARRGLRWLRRDDREIVEEAITALDLGPLADRGLAELSGGQRQRTYLARALAQQARILLLDEPFAAVDARAERDLWARLSELTATGALVVVVHHDLAVLAEHADRLVLLSGHVVAEGAPAAVLTPAHLAAAYELPVGALTGLGGLATPQELPAHRASGVPPRNGHPRTATAGNGGAGADLVQGAQPARSGAARAGVSGHSRDEDDRR